MALGRAIELVELAGDALTARPGNLVGVVRDLAGPDVGVGEASLDLSA